MNKKEETNDVFENISESLDTSFDGEEIKELVDVKNQLDKCSEIISKENSEDLMEDGEFIRENIKSLISNIDLALEKMQQDLRIGSSPRQNEAFAQLVNAKNNAINQLISMNKAIMDTKVKLNKKENPKNMTVHNNVNITSSDMLKMVEDAKKNNSLKGVKAKFRIEDKQH